MDKVRVGLIGGGFVSNLHAEAFEEVAEAELVAACAVEQKQADEFARKWKIPFATADYRKILDRKDVDAVVIGVPNHLHHEIVVAAAKAGKHVVLEKPLAHTYADGQEMVNACKKKVKFGYAETICFSPKYVRAKRLVEEGAIGKLYMAKQGEKHSGPHADWVWDTARSGGGAVMDLACHGIAFCRWFLGNPKITSVYSHMATQVHGARTQGEDEAVTVVEFEGGAVGMVESSWNRPGGMDDCIEVFGDKGQTYADMLMGNALPTYSEGGFG